MSTSFIKSPDVFTMLVIIAAAAMYVSWLAVRGKKFELRQMTQVLAMSDGADRSVEEGKPFIYYEAGGSTGGAMTIADLNVLRYCARLCVEKGAKFIPFIASAEMVAMVDGIIREECMRAGKLEAYDPSLIAFRGSQEEAPALELLHEYGVSCLVNIGAIGGPRVGVFAEVHELGGIVIGGTARYVHQGTVAMLCDYAAFMDDVYAIGAICSEDNVARATIVAGDIVKIIAIGALVLFTITLAAGIPIPIA